MKDTHQAQTIGDVEENLVRHKVGLDVVRSWLEGRMIEHDDLIEHAVAEGYPELDEDRKRMREKQSWRQAESVNDFLTELDDADEDR